MVSPIYLKFPFLQFALLFGTISLAKSTPLSSNLSINDSDPFEPPDFEDGDETQIIGGGVIEVKPPKWAPCKFDYDPCEGRLPECTSNLRPEQWNCAPMKPDWKKDTRDYSLNLTCKNMNKPVEELDCTEKCDEKGECDSLCYEQCSCLELNWSDFNIEEVNPRSKRMEKVKYCYHIRTARVDLTVAMLQCIQHDSQLASIRNKPENDFIINLIKAKLPPNIDKPYRFLIGHRIFRAPKTGRVISVVNTDGTSTNYGWSWKWGTGFDKRQIDNPWYSTVDGQIEPNNKDEDSPRWENCVSIEFKPNGTYGWTDRPCEAMNYNGFVCKQRLPRNIRKRKKPKTVNILAANNAYGNDGEMEMDGGERGENIEGDKLPTLIGDDEEEYDYKDAGTTANQIRMPDNEYREVGTHFPDHESRESYEERPKCYRGQWHKYGPFCFRIFKKPEEKMDFFSAMNECNQKNRKSFLATFRHAEMMEAIAEVLNEEDIKESYTPFWIGAYLFRTNDKIMSVIWTDGIMRMVWDWKRVVHNAQVQWNILPWEVRNPWLTPPNDWRKKCIAIAFRNGKMSNRPFVNLDCSEKINFICMRRRSMF